MNAYFPVIGCAGHGQGREEKGREGKKEVVIIWHPIWKNNNTQWGPSSSFVYELSFRVGRSPPFVCLFNRLMRGIIFQKHITIYRNDIKL